MKVLLLACCTQHPGDLRAPPSNVKGSVPKILLTFELQGSDQI